jgi:beta-N-acetylhexosaminidase
MIRDLLFYFRRWASVLLVCVLPGVLRTANLTRMGNFTAVDTTWKSLSLREKIGQTMIINSLIYDHEKFRGGTLSTFFDRYPVGGFFMADWYFNLYMPRDSIVYAMKKSIQKYSENSKWPLIFMEDYERGVGERVPPYTHLPVEMALGAASSEQLCYEYGECVALEAKDLGVNWLLHPVADLSLNPLHPLVNERAIGDQPKSAVLLLSRQVAGLQDHGIIATVKHFPGDGVSIRDQHLITASNTLDWDTWQSMYGDLFQGLIDQGAAAIMVGHITFPAVQKKTNSLFYLPSTMSREVIDLVKERMHFDGVVVSDAMNMGGAAGYYPNQLETAVACFEAGIDLMLWPSLMYMDTLEIRIRRGEISEERLNDAVQRIWRIKERFGLMQTDRPLFSPLTEPDRSHIHRTAEAVAGKAVTLIRGDKTLLPVKAGESPNLLLVVISEQDKTGLFDLTKRLLEERGFQVTVKHGLSFFQWEWRADQLEDYDKLLICFENRYLNPVGIPFLRGQEAESVWMINLLPPEKVIAISYSNPYFVNFYFEHAPVQINAYSSDPYMQEAVVKCLTGELPFHGISPVRIDHEILK